MFRVLVLCLGFSRAAAAEDVDLSVVNRIKDQAFNHSRVMDYVQSLSDEHGARLAASPGYRRAAQWAVDELQRSGVANARLEDAGSFGRSWAWTSVSVQMLTPEATTLNGVPLAWSAGSNGPISANVVFAPLWEDADDPTQTDLVKLAARIADYKLQYAGKLAGKIVLLSPERKFKLPSEPSSQRWSDEDIAAMHKARDPLVKDPRQWPRLREPTDTAERWKMAEVVPGEIQADYSLRRMRLMDRLIAFLDAERVAAVLMTSGEGGGGIIFAERFGSYLSDAPIPPPAVQLMPEHYNRLVRLLGRAVPVSMRLVVEASFPDQHAALTNVIAELPGTGERNEVVMMGAHLDSWQAGTGATDNAAGCAVVMEAMRILKAVDIKLPRTVRLGLWDGEEQGHLGSRAYVRKHLGDPVTMQLKPEHARLSAYYNIDTGTGRTRGILNQGNDASKPIFEAIMQPFAELGASTVVPRNDWGTDHMPFDAVGLPSFDLLQDELDYWTHTHHSNVDTVDHVVPEDLMISAAFLATLVYQTATRDALMPREVLPLPLPAPGPVPESVRD